MRQLASPLIILLIGTVAFYIVALQETSWVLYLWNNPWPEFRDIMSQSFYEGKAPGASDLGVTAAIICFISWVYSKRKDINHSFLSLGAKKFVWSTGLITSVFVVHTLKLIISRARPKIFFSRNAMDPIGTDQLMGIHWAGFMPFDGPRGSSFNSFPSGHTASCALLLTFCYLIGTKRPLLGYLSAVLVFIFCALMALARSMAGMHWLSDSVASFFMTWAIVHAVSVMTRPQLN